MADVAPRNCCYGAIREEKRDELWVELYHYGKGYVSESRLKDFRSNFFHASLSCLSNQVLVGRTRVC